MKNKPLDKSYQGLVSEVPRKGLMNRPATEGPMPHHGQREKKEEQSGEGKPEEENDAIWPTVPHEMTAHFQLTGVPTGPFQVLPQ